jgi:propionate CoA-transferase
MKKVKVITAEQAVQVVRSGDTVTSIGFLSSAHPEALTRALEQRFLETGAPKDLTYIYAGSQGDRHGRAGEHLAHEGMVKRAIIGHWDTNPTMGKLAVENKIEAYNFSQGTLNHWFRALAGGKIGVFTDIGLETFLDPRFGGGKLNDRTTEDLVKLMVIEGQEQLFYPCFPVNVAFLRGTYADECGNITMEEEISPLENTSVAQAVKNCGGKVIVQVRQMVASGSLDARLVKIPGIYVDAVVIADPKDHEQTFGCGYDPTLTGQFRAPLVASQPVAMSPKKVIGRRAALELQPDVVVNLGVGAPEYVALVADEEGVADSITLTVEGGAIGGVPQGGARFGSTQNPEALIDHPYQFDFYDGGGLDMAFLGLAQCDATGSINVSKFGTHVAGCGGFPNITQKTPIVYFCGTFTAGGLKVKIENGTVTIVQEGKTKKFVNQLDQITFSGSYAAKQDKKVLCITERAVFELTREGLHLIELAPGIDLQRDVLDQMEFAPIVDTYKTMDPRLFADGLMGLKQ